MRRVLGTLLMAGLLAGCGGVEGDVEPGAANGETLVGQEQGQRAVFCEDNAGCKSGFVCCGDSGQKTCMSSCGASLTR